MYPTIYLTVKLEKQVTCYSCGFFIQLNCQIDNKMQSVTHALSGIPPCNYLMCIGHGKERLHLFREIIKLSKTSTLISHQKKKNKGLKTLLKKKKKQLMTDNQSQYIYIYFYLYVYI